MSVSFASKMTGAGVLAVGTPTTIYFTYDHIFLYEIERSIIKDDEIKFKVEDGQSNQDSNIEISVKDSADKPKWLCTIKAEVVDSSGNKVTETGVKDKLKKYIKQRIPVTPEDSDTTATPPIDQKDKLKNKEKLVWDCSKESTYNSSEQKIEAKLEIKLEKRDNKFFTKLFGLEGQLGE